MRLHIKQRVFSWGQKFDVYDEAGNVHYRCAGEVFTFGKKLHIYDASGAEVIFIKQKLLSFMPRYEIYIKGAYAVTMIKKFTAFSHDFRFEGLNWRVDGDFWAHDYCVMDYNGAQMMNISKKWFSWGDTYCLDINDNIDPLICLAVAIVIDCVCHDGQGSH